MTLTPSCRSRFSAQRQQPFTLNVQPSNGLALPSSSTSNPLSLPLPQPYTPRTLDVHDTLSNPHSVHCRFCQWTHQPNHCTCYARSSHSRTTTHHRGRGYCSDPSKRRRHREFGLPTRLKDHCAAHQEHGIQPQGLLSFDCSARTVLTFVHFHSVSPLSS